MINERRITKESMNNELSNMNSLSYYKRKWFFYNEKLTNRDRSENWTIYKEFYINGYSLIIIKNKTGSKYRCKVWNGNKWVVFAWSKTPRESINKVKSYRNSDYFLY